MTERSSLDRRLAWGLFALLLASYAYFYQGGGWNENSRLDLTRALVDDQSLSIDRYHENTGDKALVDGRYYSDKAPGLSVLSIPAYVVAKAFRPWLDNEHDFVVLASYIVTVLSVSVPSAFLGLLLFRAMRRLGVAPRGAVLSTAAYGLGTLAFPLSTMLFSHQVAALALFGAFTVASRAREGPSRHAPWVIALLGGSAVVLEFPTLPAVAIVFAYYLWGKPRTVRIGWLVAGVLIPLSCLVAYLWVSFGSPLSVGYGFLADPASRDAMRSHGLFGVTYPELGVLVELLIGRYRGLLPYSPVLILAAMGFAAPQHRAVRITAAAIVVYYLLFVSSYEWWQGGSSFGSRHLAPMLPFLCLPLGWVAEARPRITAAVFGVSLFFMTVVTAVQPKPSERLPNPWGSIWRAFSREHLSANNTCPYTGRVEKPDHVSLVEDLRHDAFNAGMLLGGRGHKTLVPLLTLWAVSAWAFARATRRAEPGANGS